MKGRTKETLLPFLFEFVVYAALVCAYFFLVLHFLGGWLVEIFNRDKRLYAVVSLLLIIGQGVLLETVTTGLLRWLRSKMD